MESVILLPLDLASRHGDMLVPIHYLQLRCLNIPRMDDPHVHALLHKHCHLDIISIGPRSRSIDKLVMRRHLRLVQCYVL